METLDLFIHNNHLSDPDDLDALIEVADLTRQLIGERAYTDINRLIVYTVSVGFFEAFSWIMAILQEEFGAAEGCRLEDFSCGIGRAIPNYNVFIDRLQVDLNVLDNDVKAIPDENGEIQSFFNIFTYRTMYENIFFVSAENFDTKDNDYIQYMLLFSKHKAIQNSID
ncbi:MAG: hypothetical protein IJP64_05110 [Oscillospiraceae bacterium]|nr:hypothetical protein [Oscillospiraceae bacterium]